MIQKKEISKSLKAFGTFFRSTPKYGQTTYCDTFIQRQSNNQNMLNMQDQGKNCTS